MLALNEIFFSYLLWFLKNRVPFTLERGCTPVHTGRAGFSSAVSVQHPPQVNYDTFS